MSKINFKNKNKQLQFRYLSISLTAILSLLLFLIVLFSFGHFKRQLSLSIQENTRKHLLDATDHSNTLIAMLFEEKMEHLETISHFCSVNTNINDKEIVKLLKKENLRSSREILGVASTSGVLYKGDNNTVQLTISPPLRKALEGENVISDIFTYDKDGKDYIFFAVPIWKNGTVNGTACLFYDTRYFTSLLGNSIYNGTGATMIIQKDGKVISGYQGLEKFATFYDMLNQSGFKFTQESYNEFYQNIQNGKSGLFVYEKNGKKRYLTYKPTGINDWTTISLVMAYSIDQYQYISAQAIVLMAVSISSFLILTLVILYIIHKNLKYQKNENESNRLKIVARQSHAIIYEYNIETGENYYSENFDSVFGNAGPSHYNERIHPKDLLKFDSVSRQIHKLRQFEPFEIRIMGYDNRYQWYRVSGEVILDKKGKPDKVVGSLENIHEQKEEIKQLLKITKQDPLTKVLNKTGWEDEVKKQLNSGAYPEFAFYFIDIDDFKQFNDCYGHDTGDKIILITADTLKKVFGKRATIGRFGGDEFVVFTPIDCSPDSAITAAKVLLETIDKSSSYHITLSIGIALYPAHGRLYDDLMKYADKALYKAKDLGKNQYQLF